MNNLATRTVSAAVFTAVMVGGILWNPGSCGAIFLIVMYAAMSEFFNITMKGRLPLQRKLAIFAGAAMFILWVCCLRFGLDIRWMALCILPLICIPVSVLLSGNHDDFALLAYPYAAILYVALPLAVGITPALSGGQYRGLTLLSLFFIIWVCDVGAYSLGTLFGQKPDSRKLAPSISPKKSWWGFWGGVLFGTATGALLHCLGWLAFPLVHCLALGALVSVASVLGDLVESLWKRSFGVKDSGNCIPGHGGMLDRFDSTLVALPLAVVYMAIFGLI